MDSKEAKKQEVRNLARMYYARKDIQEAIYKFCQNREVVPSYMQEGFGKRPDSLEYPSDILAHINKGATSFHCSEELWISPLDIKTEMDREALDSLRAGWDLIIDIDSKYLDYSKITAELLIGAFEFHNIKSYKIKFSGSKGFHILVPSKAFPKEFAGKKTKDMFPEWARLITQYLNSFIQRQLTDKVSELTTGKISKYIKGDQEVGDAQKHVMPDLVLVSSRHLFRCPYSLHEKTKLASVVLEKNQIKEFQPKDADPLGVKIKEFYSDAKEGEARELLVQALDWQETKKEKTKQVQGSQFKEIKIKNLSEDIYPPVIKQIIKGMKDGRKRGLFILINYFRSLGLDLEEVKEKVEKWNKLNKPPLKEGYIRSQISWNQNKKPLLPPNYGDFYEGIGIKQEEEEKKFKNPVNYTVKKFFQSKGRRK